MVAGSCDGGDCYVWWQLHEESVASYMESILGQNGCLFAFSC